MNSVSVFPTNRRLLAYPLVFILTFELFHYHADRCCYLLWPWKAICCFRVIIGSGKGLLLTFRRVLINCFIPSQFLRNFLSKCKQFYQEKHQLVLSTCRVKLGIVIFDVICFSGDVIITVITSQLLVRESVYGRNYCLGAVDIIPWYYLTP